MVENDHQGTSTDIIYTQVSTGLDIYSQLDERFLAPSANCFYKECIMTILFRSF